MKWAKSHLIKFRKLRSEYTVNVKETINSIYKYFSIWILLNIPIFISVTKNTENKIWLHMRNYLHLFLSFWRAHSVSVESGEVTRSGVAGASLLVFLKLHYHTLYTHINEIINLYHNWKLLSYIALNLLSFLKELVHLPFF